MRQFAEDEIVIPDGPFQGQRFRIDRQPLAGAYFDAVDSGLWRRHFSTGPVQSGKTLITWTIPLLYTLFELEESAICGVPSMDMVADKWNDDIKPVIQASRYADLLPDVGPGSRGGNSKRIVFKNGVVLRFMTAGGSDKARAGKTARALFVTETDGFDEVGKTSREADKLKQLEARTRAYGDMAIVFAECTVSTEKGRTWREFKGGTESRLAIRCPHCQHYVSPEREHCIGWQDAPDIVAAGELARVCCPNCGAIWTEEQRRQANADVKLLHRGQTIAPDGAISGDVPRTNTLGFRWNAINNQLVKLSTVGQDEWKAARETDEENAEKEMRQFVWALPHVSSQVDLTTLSAQAITQRMGTDPRGYMPAQATQMTIGIDIGKYRCHWTLSAWLPNASPHVVEYGQILVPSDQMAEEMAILMALREFRDGVLRKGWPHVSGPVSPAIVLLDAGNWTDTILEFVGESGSGYYAAKGLGEKQIGMHKKKRQTGSKVLYVGTGYDLVQLADSMHQLIEINADEWKTWLHNRLNTPPGQPGAMTLFKADRAVEHLSYAKHLLSEKKIQEFVAGKGTITRWEAITRHNHYLDSTALSFVAGHMLGHRLLGEKPPQETESRPATDRQPSGWIPTVESWVK